MADDLGHAVAAVGGEVGEELEFFQKGGLEILDRFGFVTAVGLAEERGHGVNDGRVGFGAEAPGIAAFVKGGDDPQLCLAAGNQEWIDFFLLREWRQVFGAIDDEGESLVGVGNNGELFDEILFYFCGRHWAWYLL